MSNFEKELTTATGETFKVSLAPVLSLKAKVFEESSKWASQHRVNFHLLKNATTAEDYKRILEVPMADIKPLLDEWDNFEG